GADPHHAAHLLEVQVLRKHRRGRNGEKREESVDVLRCAEDERPVRLEHLRTLFERPERRPGVHGSHRMCVELEGRHDPEVATPGSAQNRSGLLRSSVVTALPSASTTSAETRLSIVRPYRRVRYPMPPPSVSPATPVEEIKPVGTARPNGCVAWSTSPQTQPAATRTVRATGSTRAPRIAEKSMTRPVSHVPNPPPL